MPSAVKTDNVVQQVHLGIFKVRLLTAVDNDDSSSKKETQTLTRPTEEPCNIRIKTE
jgi:hypothetical protein